MLRTAVALLSSLEVGARIKLSIERSVRQAIAIAIAATVLLAAAAFGLVAVYQALMLVWQFSPIEAAALLAAMLVVLAMLILAIVPLIGRPPKAVRSEGVLPAAAAEGLATVDRSLSKVMQQVGPVTLLAGAFLAGILASRRR